MDLGAYRLPRCLRGCCIHNKGRIAARKASSGSVVRWRAKAYLSRVHDDTTVDETRRIGCQMRDDWRGDGRDAQPPYLKPLLDFLHEHVTVCCETIYCQDGTIGSTKIHGQQRVRRCVQGYMCIHARSYSRKTFGAYRVWMLYPSLCLVSPAMTVKSAPAMARIVPPFSV